MISLIHIQTTVEFDSNNPKPRNRLWLWGIIVLLLIFAAKEFIITHDDGSITLAPARAAKLARELEELEQAEQYKLIAARDGHYPCFHCSPKSTIFLLKGNIWKYGITRKGEKERYGQWHIDNKLLYIIQYEGPLQECLRKEKIKIYNYALLPENLARTVPLIRPPGNKQDN